MSILQSQDAKAENVRVMYFVYCGFWFLFRLVSRVAKSEYWLRHVCLPVCLFVRLSFHPSAWNKQLGLHWTNFRDN